MPVFNELKTIAQERITVAGDVVRLTFTNFLDPPLARAALITVETATIRYLTDGTDPTASTGILAYPGAKIELHNPGELWDFRAIRQGSTSATIQVEYFG